jgi:hypothetical protein
MSALSIEKIGFGFIIAYDDLLEAERLLMADTPGM